MSATELRVVDKADWSSHPLLSRLQWGSNSDGDWHYFLSDLSPTDVFEAKRIRLQYRGQGDWADALPGSGQHFPSRGWQVSDVDWLCVEVDPLALEWRALVPGTSGDG